MELLLYGLGLVALAAGLAGIVLPALPGSPLLFVGAVLIAWAGHFTRIGWPTLAVTGALAVLMIVVDHAAAVLGARVSGASRRAVIGAAIGLVVGLFFGLPGILLGPFAGAVVGELLATREVGRAARAGAGAVAGLVAGGVVKIALAFVFLGVLAAAFFF
jgi:uncharacterized protein